MVAIAEQLAYPSATVETFRGGGSWQVVDPSLNLTTEHEVLSDGTDNTWIESDGSWFGGTRPSVLMRVQTLAGKLPLRRPYMGADLFRLRFRYRITGSGSIGTGVLLEAVDYATDHPNTSAVPFPGRRNVLMGQHFNAELVADGQWHELEMTMPGVWLMGHDANGGCKSIGTIRGKQGQDIGYDSDLGMRLSVHSAFSGSPTLQISQAWFRVDEVEIGEACPADYTVVRISGNGFQVIDNTGNWAANGGGGSGVFTSVFESFNVYDGSAGGSSAENCKMALVDAGRRAGLTKQYSGTAIVEADPSVFSGTQSNVVNQPNAFGMTIGKDGTSKNYVYWRSGTPGSPGGLMPVDGLIYRSPVVPDGYRDGNDRLSIQSPHVSDFSYDGNYIRFGRVSFYGIRMWCGSGGKAAAGVQGGNNTGGSPDNTAIHDLHDVQVTGTATKGSAGAEYTWGARLPSMRHDLRRVRFGRSIEHSWYISSPTGDTQFIDCENTNAQSFYPKHTGANPTPFNANSTFQLVCRTNSCTNNGNPPGATAPGSGTVLWEGCRAMGGTGTHYKCAHTLGSIIVRRCYSVGVQYSGSSRTQRACQFTNESFSEVGQATTWAAFGVDYSAGTWDGPRTTCTKGGGSNNPIGPASEPYPTGDTIPANNKWNYTFKEVVIEDLWASGTFGNTVIQISGADRVIIDRGFNSSGKWPFIGLWEWGGTVSSPNSWNSGGAGAFDNNYLYFRNVGTTPAAWYSASLVVQGGVSVRRFAVYGARTNPNQPSGAGFVPYFTDAQLNSMVYLGNGSPPEGEPTGYPAWFQTQKIDAGGTSVSIFTGGYNWIYPCVSAPDFDDPAVYGSYFGNARRYPNFNTVEPPINRGREMPVVTVTTGTGSGVNVTSPGLERGRTMPVPTVGLAQNITTNPLDRGRDVLLSTATGVTNVTVPALERGRDPSASGVSLDDQVHFSDYPATLNLDVELFDLVTDTPSTPGTHTSGVSGGGSVDGGVS